MKLKEKIKKNNFIVGIIGLGYVGLPLALEFADGKIPVMGFDLDTKKSVSINEKKESYIKIGRAHV